MINSLEDTIVAPATAIGSAGIAIVRLSGKASVQVADRFCRMHGSDSVRDVSPRYLTSAEIQKEGEIVDRCMLVRFESPRSYTGEEVVELYLHGNSFIVEQVLSLAMLHGARPANPGEFTQRAFLNGKIDLTQAEALAEVIAAESDAYLLAAQRQLGGELRKQFGHFREQLLHLLARLEVELDFVEEGYEFISPAELKRLIAEMRDYVVELERRGAQASGRRQGPRILILGRPNAGKSSLFNAIVGYNRALVSSVAGTTRDYIEERVIHAGQTLYLVDTAGLREGAEEIEERGIVRARSLVPESDHVLYLVDGTAGDIETELLSLENLRVAYPAVKFSLVWTKCDIVTAGSMSDSGLKCSIYDIPSIVCLLDDITSGSGTLNSDTMALLSERQRQVLKEAKSILDDVACAFSESTEILSAELRRLLQPISEMTGALVNDDVLNRLFSSFCIGK